MHGAQRWDVTCSGHAHDRDARHICGRFDLRGGCGDLRNGRDAIRGFHAAASIGLSRFLLNLMSTAVHANTSVTAANTAI